MLNINCFSLKLNFVVPTLISTTENITYGFPNMQCPMVFMKNVDYNAEHSVFFNSSS